MAIQPIGCITPPQERNELKAFLLTLSDPDFINNPNSVIIDLPSTMVVDETLLKVFGWYDNEFAYALRMLDILKLIIKTI